MAVLEPDSRLYGHLFRRAYARVPSQRLDAKGKLNGFAALDIQPHRHYGVKRRQMDFPTTAPNQFCSIYTTNDFYAEFLIDLLKT